MHETLLQLLKLDLGITHNLRDAYFSSLLVSAQNELGIMGVEVYTSNEEDQMLVVDYAAWTYRKRQEDIPLSRNLRLRINNRLIKKAGATDAVN